MTTASDNFNRADEDPLGGNWTSPNGNPTRLSGNRIFGLPGHGRQDEYWNAASFAANQYSQIKVISVSAGTNFVYAAVRLSSSTADHGYYLRTDGAALYIFKAISGTFTQLLDCGTTVSAGDTLKLAVVGNTLTAYKNGASVGTVGSGGEILSGIPGFSVFHEGNIDDWEAADIAAATSILEVNVAETRRIVTF